MHLCLAVECGTGFVDKELIPKGVGGGLGGSHKGAACSILIFPQPKLWSRFFFGGGWVSEPKDPPPSYQQKSAAVPLVYICLFFN